MNTLFIIWLIGYIVLLTVFIILLIKIGEDISLGDLIRTLFLSIGSWVIIIIGLIEYANDITIYKKKEK